MEEFGSEFFAAFIVVLLIGIGTSLLLHWTRIPHSAMLLVSFSRASPFSDQAVNIQLAACDCISVEKTDSLGEVLSCIYSASFSVTTNQHAQRPGLLLRKYCTMLLASRPFGQTCWADLCP